MKTLFALMLASTAANADSLKTGDLAKLRDPSKRKAEVARLCERDPASYALTQAWLLTARQKDGAPPLNVVCASHEYQSNTTSSLYGDYKIEKPEELFEIAARAVPFRTEPDLDPVRDSVLLVFDSKGREVRPFGGNNYTEEGYYFDFDHDGILDRADSTNYSVNETPKDSVKVFELQSIEPKPRTLLEVIFNWHPRSAGDENDWGFSCFDDNKDGIAEIAFGPASAINPEEQRKFVFRWDPVAKCYSAGEIPEHSHIRVIKSGETLASIAKSGGLGYPVIKDPDSDEASPPLISSQRPYVFRSLKDRPASEWAAFFHGKERRNAFEGAEDSFPNRLPKNLWDLTPKQAAMALAEANRTPTHRQRWKLALDDRDGLTPPKSGWLIHDWGSSGCYSFSSHLFALHFGVPDPSLTVFGYNSIGAVGRNPWADQPAHNVRIIKLTESEARFIADTVFWLDRIRTFSPQKSDRHSSRSSTADGSGTLTLYPDHAAPRKLANETVWASFISGNWESDYNQTVFINLAELLIADGIPEKLGDRWNVAAEIDQQSLVTPTKERLAPRVDANARQQLSEDFAVILERNAKDPIPAAALLDLVNAAGNEALTELLPSLQNLLAGLPPENAEDREFAALEKRFERDHFGNPLKDEETADHKKAYARYTELRDKRGFVPSERLRAPLLNSIHLLRLAESTADLLNAADDEAPNSRWALSQLRRIYPDEWSNLMASKFRKADTNNRRAIFETLATGNPAAAKRLVVGLPPAEYRDLILEIANYHKEHDRDALAKDLPVLMDIIKDRTQNYIRREEAMSLLAGLDLTPPFREELTTLMAKEIKEPQQGQYGSSTLDSAIRALTEVAGTADHLEWITTTPAIANQAFEAGFDAILQMSQNRPDRNQILADFIRPSFVKSKGMMNDIFLHALAFDLRTLAPDIAAFASENPTAKDGDGSNYSGGKFTTPVGQRYHIAREITALWSEGDTATAGRMWAFYVAAHPDQFNPGNRSSRMSQALGELAAKQIRSLPAPQRREAVDSAISLIPIPKYAAPAEAWLRSLSSAAVPTN
ncbi:MAG: hypothetical protein ABIS50_23385 [Luteolibacter sp.]|uniref:hypothetical protein n=1 Tax=Luteolibacter sp. TaxID=1962973 RepID=UPI0032647F94